MSLPVVPAIAKALNEIATHDAPEQDGTRPSDAWFPSSDVKALCEALGRNFGVLHTQIFPGLMTATNGFCTRMNAKLEKEDQGYSNTSAVSFLSCRSCVHDDDGVDDNGSEFRNREVSVDGSSNKSCGRDEADHGPTTTSAIWIW